MALREAGTKFLNPMNFKQGELMIGGYWIDRVPSSKYPNQENFIFIQKGTDQNITVPATGMLKWKLESFAEPGMYCEVYYEGTETIKDGAFAGKPSHQYKVLVDDADRYRQDAPPTSTVVDDSDDSSCESADEDYVSTGSEFL